MLITLGLDSTFGGLEAMITALCDEFPNFIGKRREQFVLVLLAFIYICALPTMTYVSIAVYCHFSTPFHHSINVFISSFHSSLSAIN
jgi:Sodium:neurotransmitter symporter family